MARKRISQPIDVTGVSVKDILNISQDEINRMTKEELKPLVQRLASAGNKRLRRLEKIEGGTFAPAYQSRMVTMGKGETRHEELRPFSTKDKELNALRQEFANLRSFFKMKTSSVSGWKASRKKMRQELGGELTSFQEKRLWKVYRKIVEEKGGLITKKNSGGHFDSDRIQQMIYNVVTQKGARRRKGADIEKEILENIDKEYKALEKAENEEEIERTEEDDATRREDMLRMEDAF